MGLKLVKILTFFVLLLNICTLSFSSSECIHKFIEGALSASDPEIIVKKHNEVRGQISAGTVDRQPRGADLKEIKYDEGLAKKAQGAADKCIYEHLPASDDRFPGSFVGQNLALDRATDNNVPTDWAGTIQAWFDEHKDYTYGGKDNILEITGHYTQVVWASTEFVGCGISFFESTDTTEEKKFQKLYVCYYGPTGNVEGEFPYEAASGPGGVVKNDCDSLNVELSKLFLINGMIVLILNHI